jgi:cytochrome c553
MQPGLLARFFILKFGYTPHAQRIADDGPWLAEDAPYGKYLAMTVCTECHGMDLRGSEAASAPNLALVVAYTLEDFTRLMREGVPIGDRELELMAEVAIGRFSHFTDAEIEALHAYLATLVNEPTPSPAD